MQLPRLIALLLCGSLAACASTPQVPNADRLFLGRVLTMDPERPEAEALAIKDGRIVAVGTERELKPYIGAETWITELGEGALLPGFIDLRGDLLRTAPADAEGSRDLTSALRAAARSGITTTTVGAAGTAELALLDEANRGGRLELDVVALPLSSEAVRMIGRRDFERYRGRLRFAGIRFDVVGDEPEEWNRLVLHCAANGVRIFASCPDADAFDRLLDALEALPAERRAEHPVVFEGAAPSERQLERCAALDVLIANDRADQGSARALTIDAAEQLEEADEKGSLVPGKRADLVVLSTDPTGLTVSELRQVEVWQTFKNGRLIYELEGRSLQLFHKLHADRM